MRDENKWNLTGSDPGEYIMKHHRYVLHYPHLKCRLNELPHFNVWMRADLKPQTFNLWTACLGLSPIVNPAEFSWFGI